jgi:hypothetical protein
MVYMSLCCTYLKGIHTTFSASPWEWQSGWVGQVRGRCRVQEVEGRGGGGRGVGEEGETLGPLACSGCTLCGMRGAPLVLLVVEERKCRRVTSQPTGGDGQSTTEERRREEVISRRPSG